MRTLFSLHRYSARRTRLRYVQSRRRRHPRRNRTLRRLFQQRWWRRATTLLLVAGRGSLDTLIPT
jgi:hypothetical protein